MPPQDLATRAYWQPRAFLHRLIRLPVDYCVVIGVVVACAIATWIANATLGDDPTLAQIERLGFGLAPIADGRLWTLVTGMLLTTSLTPPLPIFTLIGVALYEHMAKHWRTVVVLVGGQWIGVVLAAMLIWPFRHSASEWARYIGADVDFGISVGGFACLGAFTAHLPAVWRRRMRLALSCYFPFPLLFAGHVYDLSHPLGWLTGLALGPLLITGTRHPYDPAPLDRREIPWLAVVGVVGAMAGIYLGWTAGGIGGIFGWGPGDVP